MATSVQDFVKKNPKYVGRAYTANQTKVQPKQRGRGGFLSSIISELSGAGGAAGGAAAGATAGSVVPGLGTLVGGIIGAGIGGFAGGTGGRLLENKYRDNEYRAGEALKEGALSGALGVAGSGFQAARGLKAVGGMGGLRAATAGGGDEALTVASKSLLKGGKKAGTTLTNGGFDDLKKAAKLTAGRNTSERTGNSLYRSTLGIDDIVMPNHTKPTTLFKADELAGEARKIGLKGSPVDMQRQAGVQYNRFNKQVADKLAESTSKVSTTQLFNNAERNVMKQLPLKVGTTNTQDELIRTLIQLDDVATKGKVDASAIHKFKNGLNVDSAFKKISLGGNLTAKETVDLALWKEADNWIKELAPAAKALTTRQSRLYGLSQGLGRMTRTPGDPKSLVDLGARVLSPTVRKAQNAVGRGLMTVGNAQAGLAGRIPKGAGSIAKAAAGRGIANQLTTPYPTEPQELTEEDQTLYGADANLEGELSVESGQQPQGSAYPLEQALKDLQSNPDAKSRKNIMDYYDFVTKAEAARGGGGMTADMKNKAAKAKSLSQGIGLLFQNFQTAGGGKGAAGIPASLLGRTPGVRSLGLAPNAQQYEDQRKALIAPLARAISGEVGVLTDRDISRAEGLLPRLSDPPSVANKKIQQLIYLIESGGGSSSQEQQFGDLESALMQRPY